MHKSRASNKFVGGDDVPLILLDFLKNPKQTVSWKKKDKIWKKSLCIIFFFRNKAIADYLSVNGFHSALEHFQKEAAMVRLKSFGALFMFI